MAARIPKTYKKTCKCPECGRMFHYLGIGPHRALKHRKQKAKSESR